MKNFIKIKKKRKKREILTRIYDYEENKRYSDLIKE